MVNMSRGTWKNCHLLSLSTFLELLVKLRTFILGQIVPPMCNTPVLTPFALNVYDVNIVFNHGVELKDKALPSIWCVMFR